MCGCLNIAVFVAIGLVARGRGRTFAWALWVPIASALAIGAAVMLTAATHREWWWVWMVACHLLAWFVVAQVVGHLPLTDVLKNRATQGQECPSCGSVQTERNGEVLRCFECGTYTDL